MDGIFQWEYPFVKCHWQNLLLASLWSLDRLDHLDGVPLWGICLFLFVVA
jgi:hypothetical protein